MASRPLAWLVMTVGVWAGGASAAQRPNTAGILDREIDRAVRGQRAAKQHPLLRRRERAEALVHERHQLSGHERPPPRIARVLLLPLRGLDENRDDGRNRLPCDEPIQDRRRPHPLDVVGRHRARTGPDTSPGSSRNRRACRTRRAARRRAPSTEPPLPTPFPSRPRSFRRSRAVPPTAASEARSAARRRRSPSAGSSGRPAFRSERAGRIPRVALVYTDASRYDQSVPSMRVGTPIEGSWPLGAAAHSLKSPTMRGVIAVLVLERGKWPATGSR